MILEPNQRVRVLPLPVLLISTISREGVRNIAPWSSFMPILRPLDEICIASWIKRDTLDNIRETGEFVVNIPPAGMKKEVMLTAKNVAPEVDEFELAGLKPRDAQKVTPPGIEGCLAWMECVLVEEIKRENYSLIIGKVVHLEANDRFFDEFGDMDYEQAQPLLSIHGKHKMQYVRPVSTHND